MDTSSAYPYSLSLPICTFTPDADVPETCPLRAVMSRYDTSVTCLSEDLQVSSFSEPVRWCAVSVSGDTDRVLSRRGKSGVLAGSRAAIRPAVLRPKRRFTGGAPCEPPATRLVAKGKGATLTRRELNREKAWSRIYLVPLLLAEQDRDAYRRQQAANAREAEIMKDVPGWEVGCCVLPRAHYPRVALNNRPERACTTPRGTRLRRLRFCKEKRMYHHCTEAASVGTSA